MDGGRAVLSVRELGMRETKLTEANNGESCELHRGDVITLQLAENHTTPYRWKIIEWDDNVLARLEAASGYLPPKLVGDPMANVGRGGTRVFKFEAKTTGTSQILLKLWCKTEGDDDPYAQFFEATVVVTDRD